MSIGRPLRRSSTVIRGRLSAARPMGSPCAIRSPTFTLVRAHDLVRIGDGGGVEGEDITVHRVPLAGVADFVAARRADGVAMDVKLLLLLGAGWLA